MGRTTTWGVIAFGASLTALLVTLPASQTKYTAPTANSGNAFSTGSLSTPNPLTCTWTGSNQISLTWANNSPTLTDGYTYERSNTSGSGFAPLGTTTGAASTTENDTNPVPPTVRYYRVKGTIASWSSAYTTEATSDRCTGAITSIYTAGTVSSPYGVAVDSAGNVYTSSSGQVRIRKTTPAGVTTDYAGTGSTGYGGDGGPATSATFNSLRGIGFDASDNLYIADEGNNVIRRVSPGGTITTWAGNGTQGDSGDGGPATSAALDSPASVTFDTAGNGYIADTGNHRIRKVTPGGTISTVAGTGTSGYTGNGGPATSAQLDTPYGLAVDTSGTLYIADTGNNVVRKVLAGTITTVAGGGATGTCTYSGAASGVSFNVPRRLAVGASGQVYIADNGRHCVRVLNGSTISHVTGSGGGSYTGDGGPATAATVNSPSAVAVSATGDVFVSESANNVVRKIYGIGV